MKFIELMKNQALFFQGRPFIIYNYGIYSGKGQPPGKSIKVVLILCLVQGNLGKGYFPAEFVAGIHTKALNFPA